MKVRVSTFKKEKALVGIVKLREGSLTALPPTPSVGEAPAGAVAHGLGGDLLVSQLEELDGLHVRVAEVIGEVKSVVRTKGQTRGQGQGKDL